MNENKRLKEAIEYLKKEKIIYNQQDFVDKIGSRSSVVSEFITGQRVLSEKSIRKICGIFPIINPLWLHKGEGKMLGGEEKTTPYSTDLNIPIVGNEPETLLTNCEKLKSKIECLQEILSIKDGEIARLNQEIGRLQQQLDGKKGEAPCGLYIGGEGK